MFCNPKSSAPELVRTYPDGMSLVADDFVVPLSFDGPGFRLEPLGPLQQ